MNILDVPCTRHATCALREQRASGPRPGGGEQQSGQGGTWRWWWRARGKREKPGSGSARIKHARELRASPHRWPKFGGGSVNLLPGQSSRRTSRTHKRSPPHWPALLRTNHPSPSLISRRRQAFSIRNSPPSSNPRLPAAPGTVYTENTDYSPNENNAHIFSACRCFFQKHCRSTWWTTEVLRGQKL